MNGQNKTWKILELLKTTEELFRNREISSPRLNAEMLLSDTLKTERIKLYIDFEKPLNDAELDDFRSKVKRRLNNEPLQYILGKAHFYGMEFKVNSSVLIPRPETELLIDKALEYIKQKELVRPKILEIGTGSGCIAVSIAANCDCEIDAIDISDEAITIASENHKAHKTEGTINFKVSDIFSNSVNFDGYDIIVSNPPYIPAAEVSSLDMQIKDHEPAGALTDNSDGLEFYSRIIELYLLAEAKPKVFIETGDGKKDSVEQLIKQPSIKDYIFHRDLMNIYRVLEF